MRPFPSPPRSSVLALILLCVLVTGGYVGAGIYRLAVTPTRGLGLRVKYLPATDSLNVLELIRDGPAEKAGLHQGQSIVTIDGHAASRFSLYRLGLTANSQDKIKLGVKANEAAAASSASVVLASLPLRWFFLFLAFGSLVCGVVPLVLSYRYPAPPENRKNIVSWIVALAIFPVFLACVLVLISLFADLPVWVFLLLGLPACLAAPFIVIVWTLGRGFDFNEPAWRNFIVAAGILLPLPLLISIHITHPPGKDVDGRDLITDLGFDYLEALGILLLLVALFVALCWFFRDKRGYRMLPFLNAADKLFNGQAVAEELAAELQRINDAHRDLHQLYRRYVLGEKELRDSRGSPVYKSKSKLSGSPVSNLSTAPMTEKAIAGEIATFKVGDNSFSLGQFFSDLKRFWSATDPKGIFSGSIRRHGTDVRVIVSFREEGCPKLWSVARKVQPKNHGNEFARLVRELAFTIYPDIEEENSVCKTRKALRAYVEGILQLKMYFETRDSQVELHSLAKAIYFCRSAYRVARNDDWVSPLLPMLLARSCLVQEDLRRADEFSDLAMIRMSAEPNEQRNSEVAAAWWLRGWLDYKRSNYVGAERGFRSALDADRRFENAWRGMASLMLATGRRKHAVRAIAELGNCEHERLKKKNLHERRLEEEKRKNRGLKKAIILADLFQEFGLTRHARAQCRAAAKNRLRNFFLPEDIWVRIRLGVFRGETPGPTKAAHETLEKARRDLENRRARLLTRIDSDGAFRRIFKDVSELESKLCAVNAALGHVYAHLGVIYLNDEKKEGARAAEKEFRNAINVAPTLDWAYSGLGDALHRAGRYSDAEKALQVGLHFGSLSGQDNARTHHLLGDIYRRSAKAKEAIAQLKRAVELAPEWPEPHRLLGYLHRSVGNLSEAAAEFKEAVRIDDGDAYSHISLAICYEGLEEIELALQPRKRATELGDTQIADTYGRACFWALLGDPKRALQLLGDAISSGQVTNEEARNDIDLISLRDQPDFQALVQEANEQMTEKVQIAAQVRTP